MDGKSERQETFSCPDCGQRIVLRSAPKLGQRFVCTHCGTELKVVEIKPLKLTRAFTV